MTHQTIPMNIQDYTIENLISGFLPQQIYCCFVEDEAFSGKQNKNPYCFKSFDLNNFVFKVNGVSFFTVYLQIWFTFDAYQEKKRKRNHCKQKPVPY